MSLTKREASAIERDLKKRDANVRNAALEEAATVAARHKSCGCSCSQRIPKEIAAAIRGRK